MIKAISNLMMVLLLASGALTAQITVSIEEEILDMSKGNQNSFSVVIENGDIKTVEQELRKYFKEFKGKVTGTAKTEVLFDDITMKSLSDNTIDVYVKMIEVGEDLRLNTFWDLGGAYINSKANPDMAEIVRDRLRKFGIHYQRVIVGEELSQAEKELAKHEEALKTLIKTNEKLHDKIGATQRDIERTRKDISDNEVDQDYKRKEILNQKEVVAKLVDNPGREKDLADKRLKELERNSNKLEKENERMHQKVSDFENTISQAERDIEQNLSDQNVKTNEIEAQRVVVEEVQGRLSMIK